MEKDGEKAVEKLGRARAARGALSRGAGWGIVKTATGGARDREVEGAFGGVGLTRAAAATRVMGAKARRDGSVG
ncbi:hypothetical protein DL240_13145 [Lujinxingia litoralis]|uniref:Uncharacterized protein n=1 Tax=Lujinxingia litoralis TaxID=2211119 RepID=A0A328C472_9DELT|nr:hypothetical protein DL240_13145 [Lujinxingia litoralis]